jgi:hypothetical protein
MTRLLHRMEPFSDKLWQEAQKYVSLNQGILETASGGQPSNSRNAETQHLNRCKDTNEGY